MGKKIVVIIIASLILITLGILSTFEFTDQVDKIANWKTYSTGRHKVKYPDIYSPVEKFSTPKAGESTFILTNKFNFDSNNLPLCVTYKEIICLTPGKNWNQKSDIQPIKLATKNAVSFFITVSNQSGESDVLHVVQTTEEPLIEIAQSVAGMGGEEEFQKFISTVTFSN